MKLLKDYFQLLKKINSKQWRCWIPNGIQWVEFWEIALLPHSYYYFPALIDDHLLNGINKKNVEQKFIWRNELKKKIERRGTNVPYQN